MGYLTLLHYHLVQYLHHLYLNLQLPNFVDQSLLLLMQPKFLCPPNFLLIQTKTNFVVLLLLLHLFPLIQYEFFVILIIIRAHAAIFATLLGLVLGFHVLLLNLPGYLHAYFTFSIFLTSLI